MDALERVIVGDWGDVVAVQEFLDFWAVLDDLGIEIGAGGGEEKFRHVPCCNQPHPEYYCKNMYHYLSIIDL